MYHAYVSSVYVYVCVYVCVCVSMCHPHHLHHLPEPLLLLQHDGIDIEGHEERQGEGVEDAGELRADVKVEGGVAVGQLLR